MEIKRALIASLFLTIGLPATLPAQYSSNVIGYLNITLYPGDNLIANQLTPPDPSLNAVISFPPSPSLYDASTFTLWNTATAAQSFSTFDGSGGGWDNNFNWSIYDAGVLHNTGPQMTLTLVGEIPTQYVPGEFGGTLHVPPQRDPGFYLLSTPAPATELSYFTNIVGRLPRDGEFVVRLDALTQTFTTNFFNGSIWSLGEPNLNVGEAAFFNLAEVPEPSSLAMIGIGAVGLWYGRRRRKHFIY